MIEILKDEIKVQSVVLINFSNIPNVLFWTPHGVCDPLLKIIALPEIIILRKARKRKTNTIWYHLHVESKIWQMNISTNRNTCTPPLEVRRWGGKEWEFGVSRCKLLYMEWISIKVLQYSTGIYIQYPVINQNEIEL